VKKPESIRTLEIASCNVTGLSYAFNTRRPAVKRYIKGGFTGSVDRLVRVTEVHRSVPEAPGRLKSICVAGDSTGWEAPPERGSLKALFATGIKPQQLDWVSQARQLETLCLKGVRTDDLMPLGKLRGLKCLIVYSAPQLKSLDFLGGMKSLKALLVGAAKRLRDVSPVAEVTSLVELELDSGWNPPPMKLETLSPLSSLRKLEYLSLLVDAADLSLEPIGRLRKLKELELAMGFPLAEYAKLAARLPEVRCKRLKRPYEKLEDVTCKKCGTANQVQVCGRPIRRFCKKCYPNRLQACVAEFDRIRRESAQRRGVN
jgi:hypothetical protein